MPGRRCRRCQTSRPPGPRDKLSTSDRLPGRSEQKEGASAPQRPVEDRPSLPALQPAGGLWPWSSSCDSNCDSRQCSCSINLALTDKLNNEDEFPEVRVCRNAESTDGSRQDNSGLLHIGVGILQLFRNTTALFNPLEEVVKDRREAVTRLPAQRS